MKANTPGSNGIVLSLNVSIPVPLIASIVALRLEVCSEISVSCEANCQ
ncbi:MAG: hypothetical protein F6J89_21345 [Symploca sp. SIO1C4]|uniref:Uncharacterized protein n=1 Tax=Symploca sp. SIO1C4 TaxID=2607765 RepID=A0A6B3NHS1_9CYAN|nr:hypothetical protein [Symploca sp. SIO1C4]